MARSKPERKASCMDLITAAGCSAAADTNTGAEGMVGEIVREDNMAIDPVCGMTNALRLNRVRL